MRTYPLAALVAAVLAVAAGAPSPAVASSLPLTPLRQDGPTASSPPAPGPADADAFGVRLLDIPESDADDQRARQYIIDNLIPGTVIHRRIELSTTAKSAVHAEVYPDAATIANGSFIGAAGHTGNELSSWISLSRGTADIPAAGAVTDTATIAVPEDAAPGERYGIIWTEVDEARAGSIALANRVGIRVYLSVGGHNPPASNFTVDTFTARRDAHDRPIVQAQVHNTGGRALDLTGTLTLRKVHGSLTAGPYPVELGTTLAPGQSEPVLTALTDQVSNGPWDATLTLQSGLLKETYQARITFPSSYGATAPVAAHRSDGTRNTRLITGSVLGFTALGAVGVPVALRRRKIRRRGDFGRY